MAMVPVFHTDYQTIVFEGDNQLYVRKPLMELIKQACLRDFSSYERRRIAVINQTGYDRKVPIPIDTYEDIYAFPTHSPKNYKCSWLFPAHIRSITPDIEDASKSKITFHNSRSITLNTNADILNKQMHFATYCMYLFSRNWNKQQRQSQF